MARARGCPYPERHFGRWLQKAVRRKIDESSGLDYAALSRLGLAGPQLHALVAHDRMAALAHDEELDSAELLRTAASIARLGGMSKAEVIRLLQQADSEELERALESS